MFFVTDPSAVRFTGDGVAQIRRKGQDATESLFSCCFFLTAFLLLLQLLASLRVLLVLESSSSSFSDDDSSLTNAVLIA